jgi:uncharacterized protein (DUF1499 family)
MSIWATRFILVAWPLVVLAIIAFRVLGVQFQLPLLVVAVAVLIASIGILLLIIGQIRGGLRGDLPMSNVAALIYFVVGLVLVAPALQSFTRSLKVPPIHDVSTDPDNPPLYVATPALRAAHENSLELDAEVITMQRAAYGDLAGVETAMAVPEATAKAARLAESMGWQITARDDAAGHLEAVAITRLMGFKDDLVFRVQPTEAGSKLDMRSASRVGLSDIGANADRIRAFVAAYQADAK